MILQDVLTEGERKLEAAGVPEAKLNAWFLFAACFDITKSQFFLRAGQSAEEKAYHRFQEFLSQRCRRIPLEYVLGGTEFMGLPFVVNEHVLIPRQDTECLVEQALAYAECADVLDLCTGSGCIGISLAKLVSCKSMTLSDQSREALAVAEQNAALNEVSACFVESDLFASLSGRYDLIVSNPPYIPSGEIRKLMPEVKDYEPHSALDGSEDGLLFYRRIISGSISFLKEGGRLFFEIGSDQGEAVTRLMIEAGFLDVQVKQDLAGLDRVVFGQNKW